MIARGRYDSYYKWYPKRMQEVPVFKTEKPPLFLCLAAKKRRLFSLFRK